MNDLLKHIHEALSNDEKVILITIIEADPKISFPNITVGNKLLLLANKTKVNSLGSFELDLAIEKEICFQEQKTDTQSLWTDKFQSPDNKHFIENIKLGLFPRIRIAIEIISPQPCLLICGAGHIARALTQLGLVLGFRAIVIDDRAEFANPSYFPDSSIKLYAEAFEQAIKKIKLSPNMAIVIVTRGHKHDEDCLRLLLDSPSNYIGMIGSRRRVTVVKERLQNEGFSEVQLSKLYAPIGLDIGAKTPEEIALTILAEIVLVRNRGRDVLDSNPLSRKHNKSN